MGDRHFRTEQAAPVLQRIIEFVQSRRLHSRTIVRSGFVAFNALAHVLTAARSHEGDDPGRPQDRGRWRPSDVRLRAKADHQRIRNRVQGIGRCRHRCVLIIQEFGSPISGGISLIYSGSALA